MLAEDAVDAADSDVAESEEGAAVALLALFLIELECLDLSVHDFLYHDCDGMHNMLQRLACIKGIIYRLRRWC